MIRAFARGALAILLFGALIPAGLASAADDPTLLFSQAFVTGWVQTDGTYVVWDEMTGEEDVPPSFNVFAMNLSDRQKFLVATGPAFQKWPVIDQGVVIWQEACGDYCNNMLGKDLATGRSFEVATTSQSDPMIAISGKWVVWQNVDYGNVTLMARDISVMSAPITLAKLQEPLETESIKSPIRIFGDRVLWEEVFDRFGQNASRRLVTLRIGESEPQVIEQGDKRVLGYDLGADTVVYTEYETMHVITVNLSTGERKVAGAFTVFPVTDGKYVAWCQWPSESQEGGIFAYDLGTGSLFPIATGLDCPQSTAPVLDGGVVLWNTGLEQVADLHAARISDLLPSAPKPLPDSAMPDASYFPETGHFLAHAFKAFWDRSGGLPVFGFPLTEEFNERNADTGQTYTTQYVERQRLEYHPESAGTTYAVQLGRLGYEDARDRNLLGTDAFQPVTGSSPNVPNGVYFPETRHMVTGRFLEYWRVHGLELGHPGVSFAESLALFGYPISEEFVDPSTGYVTQYFERAVFEYHPDNPDPHKVLLRRLGADLLSKRGW